MSKELLLNIESHLEDDKSRQAIERVVDALDSKRDLDLPEVLLVKLNSVGDDPLKEPKIREKQEEIDKLLESNEIDADEAPIELLEVIYTAEEINELHKSGISLAEFQKLGTEIASKVFSQMKLSEDGSYEFKEVDSHKDMAVLSFYERKELRKMVRGVDSIVAQIQQKFAEAHIASKSTKNKEVDKVSKILEEMKELKPKSIEAQKELADKALLYSKLNTKDMSEWEKNLAVQKVIAMAKDAYTPPLGKN